MCFLVSSTQSWQISKQLCIQQSACIDKDVAIALLRLRGTSADISQPQASYGQMFTNAGWLLYAHLLAYLLSNVS